ncbi:MAG: hypothetical protein NW220_21850 [Leptolyngbyaceae cyanobacterium bins.349]|nr:hypothetical protein [Leptolyngbyaceae cyanobacterium bins.349]
MAAQSIHKSPHHSTHESLWCPKCDDYGLVYRDQDKDDLWECIYCGYKVNLTQGTRQGGKPEPASGSAFWQVLCAALIVLLFLHFTQAFELRRPIPSRFDDTQRSPITNIWR